MAINIKNAEVEGLVEELARLENETKTEVIRRALSERKARLAMHLPGGSKVGRLQSFLEHRVWPHLPKELMGKSITKKKEEEILGYGRSGV